MNSKATEEHGWRYTPYAYVLLKARSPEIDKPPLLRLDLDFLDTSGFVILPTESPVVPIDAGAKSPPARPFTKLQLTQILDERQSKDGKLILEVKGVALGLVPDFDEILDLKSPGFHVVKTEDQPVSVSRFDPDSADNVIVSERGWLVTLQADEGLPKIPDQFAFAKAKLDEVEMTYQRYADADLAAAQPVVSLEQRYGEPSRAWIIWARGAVSRSDRGLRRMETRDQATSRSGRAVRDAGTSDAVHRSRTTPRDPRSPCPAPLENG